MKDTINLRNNLTSRTRRIQRYFLGTFIRPPVTRGGDNGGYFDCR